MQNPSNLPSGDVQLLIADLQRQIVPRSKTIEPKSLARSAAVLAQPDTALAPDFETDLGQRMFAALQQLRPS